MSTAERWVVAWSLMAAPIWAMVYGWHAMVEFYGPILAALH